MIAYSSQTENTIIFYLFSMNPDMMQQPQQPMQPQPDIQKGVNSDPSQSLIMAVKAIQEYITNCTNSSQIATARAIIGLLARLIEHSQNIS